MRNDYADQDRHGGDSLTDAGFFVAALAAFFTFIGLMLWLVPPLAEYFKGWF